MRLICIWVWIDRTPTDSPCNPLAKVFWVQPDPSNGMRRKCNLKRQRWPHKNGGKSVFKKFKKLRFFHIVEETVNMLWTEFKQVQSVLNDPANFKSWRFIFIWSARAKFESALLNSIGMTFNYTQSTDRFNVNGTNEILFFLQNKKIQSECAFTIQRRRVNVQKWIPLTITAGNHVCSCKEDTNIKMKMFRLFGRESVATIGAVRGHERLKAKRSA